MTWAVPVPMAPDEILSSWLVRSALANGLEPLSLTGAIWPRHRAWTVDIDRSLDRARAAILAKHAGITVSAIERATLVVTAKAVSGTLPSFGTWPWILALGSRNRLRNGGMQYCPACLASDANPYFRRHWRFAWHVACGVHERLLLDRCPHCSAAIQYHRATFEHSSMAVCPACGGDLCATAPRSEADALAFQQASDRLLIDAVASGDFQSCRRHFVEAAFFALLARRVMRASYPALQRFGALSGLLSNTDSVHDFGQIPLELMRVADRDRLLAAVWRLMSLPIDDLARQLTEAGVTRQGLVPNGASLPRSLQVIERQVPVSGARRPRALARSRSPHDLPPPRPKAEVMRKWRRLLSRANAEMKGGLR